MRDLQNLESYVSGFVGAPITTEFRRERDFKTLGANLMAPQVSVSDTRSVNQRIEQLYLEWTDRNKKHLRADVELAFFEEALGSLMVGNFTHWIYIQEQALSFTQTHRDFINDTLCYLIEGRRKIDVSGWAALLKYASVTGSVKQIRVDPELIKAYEKAAGSASLPDVFVRWLSRENGPGDFFQTFRLLYGAGLSC